LLQITEYRRSRQQAYNEKHSITPQSVRRAVQESLHTILRSSGATTGAQPGTEGFSLSETLKELEDEMKAAAASLEFEKAALLRDQIRELKSGAGLDLLLAEPRPAAPKKKGGWKKKK
jgi:excinuclease ABC subunit B